MSLLMQALRKAEAKKKEAAAQLSTEAGSAAAPLDPAATQVSPTTPATPSSSSTSGSPLGELTLQVKEPTREDIAAARELAAEVASAEAANPLPDTVAEPVDYFSSDLPPPRAPLPAGPHGFDPDVGFSQPSAPPTDGTVLAEQDNAPQVAASAAVAAAAASEAAAAASEAAAEAAVMAASAASAASSVASSAASSATSSAASSTQAVPEPGLRASSPSAQQKITAGAVRDAQAARSLAGAVFAAKAKLRNRRPLVLGAAGLIVLAAIGGYGIYLYRSIAAPATFVPAQAIVLPDPTPVLPMPAPATVEVAPGAAVAAVAPVAPVAPVAAGVPVAASPAPGPAPLAVPARPAPSAPGAASSVFGATAPARRAAPAPDGAQPATSTTVVRYPVPARPDRVAAAASPTRISAPVPASAPIEVRRNDSSRQLNPTLVQAYTALAAGDQLGARSQYQRVLQQEPDNRDALLGMASIAVQRGQAGEAGAHYTRLLELDPSDPEAASGMAGLQRGDPAQAESQLKKVLAASPQTGAAHFALGNVYAQQQRWAEAQQAYFQAVGVVPSNADYAFNLAVSLDQLGQQKLALGSYQKALQLAQRGGSGVNVAAVQSRVRQLQQEIAAPPP